MALQPTQRILGNQSVNRRRPTGSRARLHRTWTAALLAGLVVQLALGTAPMANARTAIKPRPAMVPRSAAEATPEMLQGPSVPPELIARFDREAEATARVRGFFSRRSSGLMLADIDGVAEVLIEESRRTGLALDLILALIHVESSGRAGARSHAGAIGLMQLLPPTAEEVALQIELDWHGPKTLEDARANVRLGVTYLAGLIERFGDVPTALAAYNWGPTRVSRFQRTGVAVPQGYANKVLATALDPELGA